MMRALWTGASGMTAQQLSLDTISNNLSNVNTTGYKKEQVQFQSLLYQKLQHEVTNAQGEVKPVIGQVGLGVRTSAIVSSYKQGSLIESPGVFNMAISGNGFFAVRTPDGSTAYTRNGAFGLSIGTDGIALANADGLPLLDTTGTPIVFDSEIDTDTIKIDEFGEIRYTDAEGLQQMIPIALAQFNNPAGLEKMGESLLMETASSGMARLESEDAVLKKSKVLSGYLEGSNVQTADEIVNLIITQRAYEMNSKSITAADEMLQQANNLRR